MSKIIDITNKLNFEEKPIFKINDVEIEANNDAIAMLKIVAIFENDNGKIKTSDILDVYNLLFDEENQKKIEILKLNLKDFTTFVMETAQTLINDGEEVKGETKTPATT
jgi:hypothetical protein